MMQVKANYTLRNLKHRQGIDDGSPHAASHQTSAVWSFFSFDFVRKLLTWIKPSGGARSPSLGNPTASWPVLIHRFLCTLKLSATSRAVPGQART